MKGTSPESLRAINVRRAKLATQAGQYRKGIQALTSEGLAPTSEATLLIMRAKHTQSPPPPCPSTTPPPSISVSPRLMSKALHSFPSDSAPGPSLLRANHLKEAIHCPSAACGDRALRAITETTNLLASGGAPEEVASYLYGAILLPIKKKCGGLRPIAVGEVLRRLTSKCLSQAVHLDAIDILAPLQVGVGVKAGCEAVIHSVSHILEKQDLPALSRWILLVDFSNAFNSVSRDHMFSALRLVLPGLSRWIEWCYSSRSILRFGDHSLLSCCGVQQGDPLGPLCFALTLQPVIERINSELPDLLCNAWYLDDGTLCGTPQDLADALKIIEEEGPPRGLYVNRSKSLLYIPPGDDQHQNKLPPDVPISSSGFCLLGVPLGSDNFCEKLVLGRVEKIRCMLERLKDLGDSQLQTTLLRSCLSLPKFNYSLRTCPPSLILNASTLFDNSIREVLEDITGSPLSDWSWSKAILPCSMGGLNVRSAVLHAPAAYISSIAESAGLVSQILCYTHEPPRSVPSAISSLASSANMASWHLLEDIDIPLRQKSLSHSIDEAGFSALVEAASDVRSKALALSTSLPHAGDWLNVVPSPALGLCLLDQEFRLCLDYWLGVRMTEGPRPCPACGKPSAADPMGDHQVGCGGNGDRIHRHDALRDALFAATQSAALAPRKEVPSLIPDSVSRPADIFLPNWCGGRPAALDVTVISTMQPLTQAGAAAEPGFALGVAVARKMAAHNSDCHGIGVSFLPIVAETLGGWSPDSIAQIARIGRLAVQRLDIPPATAVRHLFQRLSIILWKGNATLWSSRLPLHSAWVDGNI